MSFTPCYAAFPQVESVTETQIAAGTAHLVNMPAAVNAGDLLIILFSVSDETVAANNITTPTDEGVWTELYKNESATFFSAAVYAKVAAGTEAGQTVDIVSSVSQAACSQVYRISAWFGAIAGVEAAIAIDTQSANPNPPSLNPSAWGIEDTLWLAVAHAGDDDATVTAYPTNFTNGIDTVSGAGANAGCEIGSARRENAVEAENPPTYTLSESERSMGVTIGVRPSGITVNNSQIIIITQE